MKPLNTVIQLAATSSLVLATSAIGAPQDPVGQITRIDGLVMVTQGSRYIDAREGMDLKALDRLLVLEDASAILTFSDGCKMTIDESSLLSIAGPETCGSTIERAASSQLGGSTGAAASSGTSAAGAGAGAGGAGAGAGGAGAGAAGAGAGAAGAGAGAAGAGAGAAGAGAAAAGAGAAAAGAGAATSIGGGLLAGIGGLGAAGIAAAGAAVVAAGAVAVESTTGNDNNPSPPPISQ